MSRATAYKWLRRFRAMRAKRAFPIARHRPRCSPRRTPPQLEARICVLRHDRKFGPARIGYELGVAPSTVHRVLVRYGIYRLAWMDRPTGRVIRRYERARPGELVHVDIKKLGRLPRWRRPARARPRGTETEAPRPPCRLRVRPLRRRRPLAPRLQRDPSRRARRRCAAFLERAIRFYRDHGITDRARPDRQRLPTAQHRLCTAPRRARHRPPPDPALPAADQRQSRTLQPHPARRMGLRQRLYHRRRRQALTNWLDGTTTTDHTPSAHHPPAASTTSLDVTSRSQSRVPGLAARVPADQAVGREQLRRCGRTRRGRPRLSGMPRAISAMLESSYVIGTTACGSLYGPARRAVDHAAVLDEPDAAERVEPLRDRRDGLAQDLVRLATRG